MTKSEHKFLRMMAYEHKKLLDAAENEVCSSIRAESRDMAAGYAKAINFVTKFFEADLEEEYDI